MKKNTKIIAMLWMLLISALAIAKNTVVWIDVRTPPEFNQGHVKGAVLIPHNLIHQKITAVVADKKQPINLYCRSGRRALIALKVLERMGYTHVQNLGGLSQLAAQGIALER